MGEAQKRAHTETKLRANREARTWAWSPNPMAASRSCAATRRVDQGRERLDLYTNRSPAASLARAEKSRLPA
jgi:hypothetical protein